MSDARRDPGSPLEPARIGHYRLLSVLGRGGMGVVYAAERADGQFRRRVALKVLKVDGDPALAARIVAERQILAALDHPNIAKLLDGGLSEDGRPYLVIEHVSGLPIDVYCERMRLSTAERLQLFITVARAVDHAHHNLIVHRDLKPSNILVTPAGEVKLLDFGIAKLLNPSLAGVDAPITQTDSRVFTPEYASPEQVRGEALTTSSDVYSLGVVLYELLAGHRPYELAGRSLQEMIEAVCERDPEHLDRRLHADLDAIVRMALRKEPGRRYGSAEMLAQDIERHLDGRPVRARRGTKRYRFMKFVRRHRTASLATAAIAFSLLTGALVAAREASRARGDRDRAEAALAEATEVTEFLLGMFESSDPAETTGEVVTAADLLRRGALRADQLGGQPVVQARMLEVMSRVQASIGRYGESLRMAERAVAALTAARGDRDTTLADALHWLATPLRHHTLYDSARAVLERARSIRAEHFGPRHVNVAATLLELGSIAIYRDSTAEAERLRREAYEIYRDQLGPGHPATLDALYLLATAYRHTGRFAEAEAALKEVLQRRTELGSAHATERTNDLMMIGMVLTYDAGRPEEAEPYFAEALAMTRGESRPNPHRMGWALGELAALAERRGDRVTAERLLNESLDIMRAAFGDVHPSVAGTLDAIGGLHFRAGQVAEAAALHRQALAIDSAIYGTAHSSYASRLASYAASIAQLGEVAEAEAMLRRAIELRRRAIGPHPNLITPLLWHAGTLGRLGRYAEADSAIAEAIAIAGRADVAPVRRASVHEETAAVYELLGRAADAEHHRREAMRVRSRMVGA